VNAGSEATPGEAMKLPRLDEVTVHAVEAEVVRARLKFPGSRFLLAALMEEVGELAQAMLQKKDRDEIQREAIQVACVALRICEEGDATFADLTDAESKP
jgi:NTP pyrophosphatase (non-canonical NTP hydrolase)